MSTRPTTSSDTPKRTICVAAVRLTLTGFDTHTNQLGTQARLLGELAGGLTALKSALVELGRWNESLIVTYAEFGRRPKENLSLGTDHGTANTHFALGGRVIGGLYGEAADLTALTGEGNSHHALDFRAVYATVLERWWNVDARATLGERFAPVPFLRNVAGRTDVTTRRDCVRRPLLRTACDRRA